MTLNFIHRILSFREKFGEQILWCPPQKCSVGTQKHELQENLAKHKFSLGYILIVVPQGNYETCFE